MLSSGGEAVVLPHIAGTVFRGSQCDEILLQKRDKAGEPVRGRSELPGGRWRAGELPDVALAREVAEETGVQLLAVSGSIEHLSLEPHVSSGIGRPVAVVSGSEGAYPALHVLFECRGPESRDRRSQRRPSRPGGPSSGRLAAWRRVQRISCGVRGRCWRVLRSLTSLQSVRRRKSAMCSATRSPASSWRK